MRWPRIDRIEWEIGDRFVEDHVRMAATEQGDDLVADCAL
jgi:hypothetical protein